MQVHVKTPLIELTIKGDQYNPLIELLKKDFGDDAVKVYDDDELLDITQSQWFLDTELFPGDTVKFHRQNLKMTQLELGDKMGGKSRQFISDLEKGRRNISINLAKELAEVLGHHYKAYL
jgi:DNA-binding XRE family transcriptional regulator